MTKRKAMALRNKGERQGQSKGRSPYPSVLQRMKVGKQSLSIKPQHISDHVWYYEEERGLDVIIEVTGTGTQHVTLPWRKVVKSVERYKKSRTGGSYSLKHL